MRLRALGATVVLWVFLLVEVPVVARADDPPDVVTALENAVANAIENAQPSIVAITRIPSEKGETLAVRGKTPDPPEPVDGLLMPDSTVTDRPGFPYIKNTTSPTTPSSPEVDFYALPENFGGGVVIGRRGEILTVYHLLKGAGRIRVRGKGMVFDAEIIAADPRIDLAVIMPRAGYEAPPDGFQPMRVGEAERLRQGSFLVALGNPYNAARDGKASASLGILANTGRRLDPPVDAEPSIRKLFRFNPTLIQLDSKLNLGMSGGAVINLKGELIGITTAAASPAGFDAAAGYAIPMDPLGRRALNELIEGREVEYSFIGIALHADPNRIGGVGEGTPAFKANLKRDDIILAVGDRTLEDHESALPLALAVVPVGEPVILKVLREGRVIECRLVMSKYPPDETSADVIATNRPRPWRGLRVDFLSILGGGQAVDLTFEKMRFEGVAAIEVESGSAAALAGLKPQQIITAVDGKPVATPAQFREAVKLLDGKPVVLTVMGAFGQSQKFTVAPR